MVRPELIEFFAPFQARDRLRRPAHGQPEAGVLFDHRLRLGGPVEPKTRLRLHRRVGGRSDGGHGRRGAGEGGHTGHGPDDRHVRARRDPGGRPPRRRRQDRLRPVVHAAGHAVQSGIELSECG